MMKLVTEEFSLTKRKNAVYSRNQQRHQNQFLCQAHFPALSVGYIKCTVEHRIFDWFIAL